MPLYLMSYDAHKHRDYTEIYKLMDEWRAARLLESLWLGELRGPAETIRDIMRECLDNDDSVAVIELEPTAEWATRLAQETGTNWLWQHIPYRA